MWTLENEDTCIIHTINSESGLFLAHTLASFMKWITLSITSRRPELRASLSLYLFIMNNTDSSVQSGQTEGTPVHKNCLFKVMLALYT